MKQLESLITGLPQKEVIGLSNVGVNTLVYDSRNAGAYCLFFAIAGTQVNGHNYIEQVINNGCQAIVCETLPNKLNPEVCYIKVPNSAEAMGLIANEFYNNPSQKIKLIAVTGTNGKTTIATLLFKLFRLFNHKVGLLSTVQNQINETVIPSTHTTPDSIKINELLANMVNQGCEYVFMEASSHAIHQHRIKGLDFDGAVFSNITHDHLDYHQTFANYIAAKKKLFDDLPSHAFSLTNKDDKNGTIMLQNTKATRYSYGIKTLADFKGKVIEHDFNGMLLNIDGQEAWFRLVGNFNASNILAVYATAFLLGKEKTEIIQKLSMVESVKGRFDYVKSNSGVIAVIDYAHTPDALKNVIDTINEVRTQNENLITVVGCGGNRDAAKRPVMAAIASDLSNKVILTSDNPRNENPEIILDEMQAGVKPLHYKKVLRITDRKEAIKAAVMQASKGDVILIAGKGHENYQEINGVKHHFDDKETVLEMFKLLQ